MKLKATSYVRSALFKIMSSVPINSVPAMTESLHFPRGLMHSAHRPYPQIWKLKSQKGAICRHLR